jgi:hypothetical protein
MLAPEELAFVLDHASVAEQLPTYVTAVSGAEPFLEGDYLAYRGDGVLIFIGYPLAREFDADDMDEALRAAVAKVEPRVLSVAAPVVPASMAGCDVSGEDSYYRLPLAGFEAPPKIRNMVARAGRELTVGQGDRFRREHRKLVKEFLAGHDVDEGTRFIFGKIPDYLGTGAPRLYEARDARGRLAALDVADFSARDYAFCMFSFRSAKRAVPGASDLLLATLVEEATAEGKCWLCLGLGIGPGVTFFKTKWGGVPYLRHLSCVSQSTPRP